MVLQGLIFVIGTTIILSTISWKLTLFTVGGILLICFVFLIIIEKYEKLEKEMQDFKSELGEVSEETCSNIRTVKAFANEHNEIEKFKMKN